MLVHQMYLTSLQFVQFQLANHCLTTAKITLAKSFGASPFFMSLLYYNMPVVQQKIRRKSSLRPEKITSILNLREFSDKRNKVLFLRGTGGLGDILMHRMLFEDIKKLNPQAEIHFACPKKYHDAVVDHPFIDRILDVEEVQREEYLVFYNTTTACGRYEMGIAPLSGKHRSDIWANHCGFDLTKHDMQISVTENEKSVGKKIIEDARDRDGPSVALCPVSAMLTKNLLGHQMVGVVDELRKKGCYVFGLHSMPVETLLQEDVPMIQGLKIRPWMSVINQADYVISVDTSHFHCAGGMKKPLTGIFTFADGLVYGKYFDCEIVQKHRDRDPEWTCGPCYNWCDCTKTKEDLKPCLTEISVEDIMEKVNLMFEKCPI